MPSRLIAPAPASNQAHISKVPSHITMTIESTMPTTPTIPVATISGQQVSALCPGFPFLWLLLWLLWTFSDFMPFQGHSSNLHHLMPANIHIIRGQISAPTVPPQTFTSHLPRGRNILMKSVCQGMACLVLGKENMRPTHIWDLL